MKKLLLLLFTFSSILTWGQYNNEWIDYSKTYYKFPVGKDGLYRIPKSVLAGAGLENTPVEYFQLWRNGIQVPIYTSVASGTLDAAGYLEFWGEMNDGKPDAKLYRNINDQLNDKWSLETDTASFFLTVNPAGNNLRLVDEDNNIAGNTLAAESYFMYTYGKYFKNRINPGYAGLVGEYVYSSAYDKGEGYTSGDIRPASPLSETVNNLYVYTGGPNAQFYIAGSGNALYNRNFQVSVNSTQVINVVMNVFNDTRQLVTLPLSLISSGSAVVKITNTSDNPNDRMVVAKYELTYPRQYNFGNSTNFIFELPASDTGNYLRITNFNRGSAAPILYDLSDYKRYTGDISESGIIKFALPPSAKRRKLVLMNALASNITTVSALSSRNFIDFSQSEHQGNYLIISNRLLYDGPNGNPVQAYAQYRNSEPGGGYDSKIYEIDQLTDQFAFGIKRHPGAVKKFVQYAEDRFQSTPQAIFIIGKGVNYIDARTNQSSALLSTLNLVPPFGHPASDNLLVARESESISSTPVGRLSAISPGEVEIYLQKVKEYEAHYNAPQTANGRLWMKNILHAIGGGDADLTGQIGGYMNQLRGTIEDTLFGAKVMNFTKSSAIPSEISGDGLKELFTEGIGIINYFGHSSASTLEFNIDDPYVYNNEGKYPFFLVNGCLAGDIFMFDVNRLNTVTTLSEKYIMADRRGSIGFIASSHFGIVNYMNSYLKGFYKALSERDYGHSVGEILEEAFRYLQNVWGNDYFARIHAEEITLHGDPAIRFYSQTKPDYIVEDQMVRIPSVISVADKNFTLGIKFFNIGKAVRDSMTIEVKRQLPDGSIITVLTKRIAGIKYADSVEMVVPVNGIIDKGENKFIITLDTEDEISEISEMNNRVTKSFFIVDDGAKPIYPSHLSIVNSNNLKFIASTSNPLSSPGEFKMEIDTTEFFNSALKKSLSVQTTGGIIEFNPGITLMENTVYYWRVAAQSDELIWNNASFIYINDTIGGYNQSHYFQFKKNTYTDMDIESDRSFQFEKIPVNLNIRTGLYPNFVGDFLRVTFDEDIIDRYGCSYNSVQFVVYDAVTLKPWGNSPQGDGFGRFGSVSPCGHNIHTFEFNYGNADYRRKAVEFLENLPAGSYVSITNLGMASNTTFINTWKNDTLTLGSNRSLYHLLKQYGVNEIDSFTHNIPFLFLFRKGDPSFAVKSFVGSTVSSYLNETFQLPGHKIEGMTESEWFGPALQWNKLLWEGADIEGSSDQVSIDIFGKDVLGNETFIRNISSSHDTTLSFIDPKEYPYLKLRMNSRDSVNGTPHQLKYWRLFSKLPPEGAVAPNIFFMSGKDTLTEGEILNFGIAFKNISDINFDSLKVKLILIDKNNVQHLISLSKRKPLISGDTVRVEYQLDTKGYPGTNALFISFNPDDDQPEQYYLNNFLYKGFYVKGDEIDPLLDVTIDGVHILNNDIISAKPHILIKLKDENQFLALDDTALIKVQIRYPDGELRTFSYNSDTLRFSPASYSDNGFDNTASVDFNPQFFEDGEYQLVVSGRDKGGNTSGNSQYTVSFKIINKPMISNMFNYPNPFTTSTAFVFTLTGSEVPQNLRIQILTITGKIVREITKEELGPVHIGRNITEFKWNGTDQYGQKLANGVYLYRVISNLNGKSLDKYKTEGDQTDQYFNNGYGKMYLMR